MSKKLQRTDVRYDPEQKIEHQKKADEAGLSLSEFLRKAADNAEIIVQDETINIRVISEINKFGNNINQLAKAANIANLSGNISDETYKEFIFRLKLYTDEIKVLGHIVKIKGNL